MKKLKHTIVMIWEMSPRLFCFFASVLFCMLRTLSSQAQSSKVSSQEQENCMVLTIAMEGNVQQLKATDMYNMLVTIKNCGKKPVVCSYQTSLLLSDCFELQVCRNDSCYEPLRYDIIGRNYFLQVNPQDQKIEKIRLEPRYWFQDKTTYKKQFGIQLLYKHELDNNCGTYIAKSNVIDVVVTRQ